MVLFRETVTLERVLEIVEIQLQHPVDDALKQLHQRDEKWQVQGVHLLPAQIEQVLLDFGHG